MQRLKHIATAIWTRLRAVQWNRHTFALLLGAAVALVPDLTDLAEELTATGWRPLLVAARIVGYGLTAIAVASKVYVRVSPVLDRLDDMAAQPAVPIPSTPTPITVPNPTGGQSWDLTAVPGEG